MKKTNTILPRLLNLEEAARYCGVGPRFFIAHFPIQPLKIGSKKLYDRSKIDNYIEHNERNVHIDPIVKALQGSTTNEDEIYQNI